METKTHWKKVFNKDYLGACDLEDNKDLKAVIKKVEIREVKDPQGTTSKRNVAIFTTNIKPMILNVSNCKVLKKFAKSQYIEDWVNIPVSIYIKDDVKAFGEITEGLRFRDVQPKVNKPELTPDLQAWAAAITYLKGTGTMILLKEKWNLSQENEQKLKDAVL